MPTKNSLLFFRDKINKIDRNIVKLLAERKHLVLEIAQSKIKNKQEIRDLEREKTMINELTSLGKINHLEPAFITQLFQVIIEESVLTQKKTLQKFNHDNNLTHANFAVLGPKGSYSHIAACKYSNQNIQTCNIQECLTFQEVIKAVEKHQSDYAILPLENTCSGYINEVLDLLEDTNLFIVGEINIFVNHCLLSIEKITLEKIKNIYSHPQPFKQCSNFIKKFPNWTINYTNSTADAMKIISESNQKTNAALGSEIGSKIYGLKILSKNLANEEKNITKFIILNRNLIDVSKNKNKKIIFLFTIKKKSGALANILSILKNKKIIIKKLTDRTLNHQSLEEKFYIEIQVNLSSILIKETLKKIKKFTTLIKILGSYPYKTLS
ncbi:chorismate mutase [Buchnera aphidicola]|uniref:Bifunctional chorismate mutase/prephenate dehydratase n=1 Tax=Buchnera aphidicola str. Ua (Uroleucon ambrosiae) TaxID=1005057 RepID=G2LPP1_BUCUM|nr:chorismate mutase [Buchnera aphidicola]AEO08178.1 chorismate mutase [Buchnera aphidicola str. Ua (Uroleucon ambrosiae)]